MQIPLSKKGSEVLSAAKTQYPEVIKLANDIGSPVGFIHGYDITKLLLAAIGGVELSDDMLKNRNLVRLALENIRQPVEGLVKTYQHPYSVFSASNVDAHEALGEKNYCMAYYNEKDDIVVINP
jgi:branched-chain amino acid transport system substrate-binding protein